MANNYWMKLWFDILIDPKMGTLPDRLWRRVIELFLLAGKNGSNGYLPDIKLMAWTLNITEKSLIRDLREIEKLGIVSSPDGQQWIVTNFAKRNAKIDGAKRVKDFRDRQRNNPSDADDNADDNADVTNRYQEEQRYRGTEEQIKTEAAELKDLKPAAAAFSGKNAVIYRQVNDGICEVTEKVQAAIDKAVDDYSVNWVRDAVGEAIRYQANTFGYAEKVLARWKTSGRGNGSKQKQTGADLEYFRKLFSEANGEKNLEVKNDRI